MCAVQCTGLFDVENAHSVYIQLSIGAARGSDDTHASIRDRADYLGYSPARARSPTGQKRFDEVDIRGLTRHAGVCTHAHAQPLAFSPLQRMKQAQRCTHTAPATDHGSGDANETSVA